MGKRSDFERKPRDFYPTPFEAVEPLIKHLPREFTFAEPCAGDGALVGHLEWYGGACMWAFFKFHFKEQNHYKAIYAPFYVHKMVGQFIGL